MDARLATWLARHLIEDDMGRITLPYHLIDPRRQDVLIPSWDEMLTDQEPIPVYPVNLNLLSWPHQGRLKRWLSPIPPWIRESVALFEQHQLQLLHYAARYPQMLELLDQAPVMAWKLIAMPGSEAEKRVLLNGKRTCLIAALGAPFQLDGVRFLRQLRLRQVSQPILEQIDTCLLDADRLAGLARLPRVNSMALTLAAKFPELIGSRLHRTLAQLPCRPMQCQAMIALLEDAFRLASSLGADAEIEIGECRYLTDVESRYQHWLTQATMLMNPSKLSLIERPQRLQHFSDYVALSLEQKQAWWLEADVAHFQLWTWMFDHKPVGVLIEELPLSNKLEHDNSSQPLYRIVRIRYANNQLPPVNLITQVELWLLTLGHQDFS